ncbi:glycosyltransferase [Kitasatospora viridis]|uniref:UDP:flavonoid glycosyltransferase YjiC (YdhE family) n=2 Tax=Kitasatospora viridis TaxID=281105 RepID=A0A561T7E6_9ACTN|nr:glycosyltransferase [Kitasatospora viridis]TWF83028.1 UDP:flavonoid glycosyltransferase YjiC (YdhE family) [Kitasatospora viridis]
MRIQIVTVGTTGSVAPYTGLAHRLLADGHQVELATHAAFEPMVACCGLRMRPLTADPFAGLIAAHAGRARGLAGARALVSSTSRAARALVDDLLAAVDPAADLVLLSTLATPVGWLAAEHHGVPSAGVYLQPDAPTREFGPSTLPWRDPGAGNVRRAQLANGVLDALHRSAVRTARRRLGVRASGAHRLRLQRERAHWPIHHGISPSVLPRPADWRPELTMDGYWWPHLCPDWRPPDELVDFLAAGPPPVLIGFGSMMPGDPEQLGKLVVRALRAAGLRGIVQSGWAGLRASGDDILTIGAVPHSWLLPYTAAVVHHAGAGTSAATLRAGVPSVPVPVFTDQPWWAARLVQLGAAGGVLPIEALTADRLADALQQTVRDGSLTRNARALSAKLEHEDGAGAVARAVGRRG